MLTGDKVETAICIAISTALKARHQQLCVLTRDDVALLFARADLFIDASKWQAFGRTGLEAMAAGCVPLLPAGSGASEYAQHGFNSMLVDTDDAESVATSRILC